VSGVQAAFTRLISARTAGAALSPVLRRATDWGAGAPSCNVMKKALIFVLGAPLVAAGMLQASMARADEASSSTFGQEFRSRVAEQLFTEGRKLMEAGEFAEACGKFEKSQRLDPGVGTALNLAVCHEHQGRTATAWREYVEALRTARTQGRADRIQLAEDRIRALEPKLARIQIVVPESSAVLVNVTFDGVSVPKDALNVATPLDPGSHEIVVRLPSRTIAKSVELEPAQTLKLTLSEEAIEASAREAIPPPLTVPRNARPIKYSEGDPIPPGYRVERHARTGLIVGGIATLGIGALVTMGGISQAQSDNYRTRSEGKAITGAGVMVDFVGVALLTAGLFLPSKELVPQQAGYSFRRGFVW
jgi:hypothetical protein